MPRVTTHPVGATRVGVNVDDQPAGHAFRVPGTGEWTAYVRIPVAPFDVFRPGFPTAAAACAFIADHGYTGPRVVS